MIHAASLKNKNCLLLCYHKQPSLQKKPVDSSNKVARLDQLALNQIYFTDILVHHYAENWYTHHTI